MPGRQYNTNSMRYGFNGKENDNEVKGTGNQQDYGMRIYDTRLGRFLSVDPIAKEFPELTPYQFAGNMPIVAIDLDGLEPAIKQPDGRYTTPRDGRLARDIPKAAIDQFTPKGESPKLGPIEQFAVDVLTPIGEDINTLIGTGGEKSIGDKVVAAGNLILLGVGGEGKAGGPKGGMARRRPSIGDKAMPSERAARRQAFREKNVRTSEANNYTKKPDPDNKNFNILEAKDINGNDVQIKQHPDGHEFKDNNTYEEPHYHGKDDKGHITYPKTEK